MLPCHVVEMGCFIHQAHSPGIIGGEAEGCRDHRTWLLVACFAYRLQVWLRLTPIECICKRATRALANGISPKRLLSC